MGQLFLWTNRISEDLQEAFREKFGFSLPQRLLDIHENLPEEFHDYLGFLPIEDIIEEKARHTMMLPGLIPFAQEKEGDLFCFYRPWQKNVHQHVCGIWMRETNHFLPISSNMTVFLLWWLHKEVIDLAQDEDFRETLKILELFLSACGLDEFGNILETPPSLLSWHSSLIQVDPDCAFSQTFTAVNQSAMQPWTETIAMLERAKQSLPHFGAPYFWLARFNSIKGQLTNAHEAYWQHMQCPMHTNGYHTWWDIGDLLIPETSELEALSFFNEADIKASQEILDHPRVTTLREMDPHNFRTRMILSGQLQDRGDMAGALTEMENAYFLESWNDSAAYEILGYLKDLYDYQNFSYEAEMCNRIQNDIRLQVEQFKLK